MITQTIKDRGIWLVGFAIAFPLIQLLFFFIRFGTIETHLYGESLLFAPIGFLGGIYFFYMYDQATITLHRRMIFAGLIASLPSSVVGGIMGGLLGFIGVILFGLLPMVIGVFLGNWFGRVLANKLGN